MKWNNLIQLRLRHIE